MAVEVRPELQTEAPVRPQRRVSRAVAMTTPLTIVRGEGAELVADDGRRYLDFVSGYGVTNTGHCHPLVVAAIQRQAAELLHVSTVGATELYDGYSARLCSLAPMPDAKLFYVNSGTEAVEAALKLARYATGRPNVVSFAGGFHGRTLGSLSVSTSKAAFRAHHEPLLPGTYTVPYPGRDDELEPTLAALDQLFTLQVVPERVAAIIVEPVLGEGGYVVPPDGLLPAVRQVCDRHGILMIVDEVQAGFGRTGRLFACQHSGVVPDLVAMGKGIASGLPMGALVGRSEVMDAWAPGAHGNTFGGNPVVLAAADATLDVLLGEGLVDNAAQRGDQLLAGLRDLAGGHGAVHEVRGRGLMIGIEFASAEATAAFKAALLAEGVVVSTAGPHGSVVRLSPPLILTDDHVQRFLAAARSAFAGLDGSGGTAGEARVEADTAT